jgi:hypothetical protein
MARPNPVLAAALVAALLALSGTPAAAQMFTPTGRGTLRGLPGVEVVVEPLPPELEASGLTADALRLDVTRRLAAAGIAVYASQGENGSPAQPYLYVHLNALSIPEGRLAVALLVQVRQAVDSVVGPARIVDAVTWDAHNVLALPPGDPGGLHRELELYVDQFIDDWRAVH